MSKSKNNISEKLCRLISENPELPLIATVNGDVVGDEEFAWYIAKVKDVQLGEYAHLDGIYFTDRDDFAAACYELCQEELCEKYHYNPRICKYLVSKGIYTEEELAENMKNEAKMDAYLDKKADEMFKKAIILSIGTLD